MTGVPAMLPCRAATPVHSFRHRREIGGRRLPVFPPCPEPAADHRSPPVRAKIIVVVSGLEPPTSRSRTLCASRWATLRL